MHRIISIGLSVILIWWNSLAYEEQLQQDPHIKAIVADIDYDEFVLFSSCVEAESDRTDNFEGRVLIAETILNRVNSSEFPDTISGVIYQSGQFEVVANGSIWSCGRTDLSDMAIIEAINRVNSGEAPNVMYFNATGYAYGTPYCYEGGNYFVTI